MLKLIALSLSIALSPSMPAPTPAAAPAAVLASSESDCTDACVSAYWASHSECKAAAAAKRALCLINAWDKYDNCAMPEDDCQREYHNDTALCEAEAVGDHAKCDSQDRDNLDRLEDCLFDCLSS